MTSVESTTQEGRFRNLEGPATLHDFCDFLSRRWHDLGPDDPQHVQTMLDAAYSIELDASSQDYFQTATGPDGKEIKIHPIGASPIAYVTLRNSSIGVVPETWAWMPDDLKQTAKHREILGLAA